MNPAFSLLIKPAGPDCNLHCQYCFYRDRMALFPETPVHRMSVPILENLVSGYMATDQTVHAFAWQGGEPLLMGQEFFQRAINLQCQYGHSGTVVQNSLQTNGGLLTDDLAIFFSRHRFLFGISLDGPASVHDRYRVNAAGHGTFNATWRGIECLRRQYVEFNVLTLVTQANVRRGRELYHYFCDQDLRFQQYIPCSDVNAQGAPLPYSISGEAWGEFLCEIYDQWIAHDTHRVSIRLFDSILNLLVDHRYVECSLSPACNAYVVVEHNGDIYPCDFYVESRWRLGNITTIPWNQVLASPLYQQFSRRKSAWNKACAACQWRRYCAGDCLKHRAWPSGDSRQLSRLCQGWKVFYAHTYSGFQRLADQIRRERARDHASTGDGLTKPGRNDRCPCGSGLKYKKCCQRIHQISGANQAPRQQDA